MRIATRKASSRLGLLLLCLSGCRVTSAAAPSTTGQPIAATHTIKGVFRDRSGRPIPHARVRLVTITSGTYPGPRVIVSALSDAMGRYTLETAFSGHLSLTAVTDDASGTGGVVDTTAAFGAHLLVDIERTESLAQLTGTVRTVDDGSLSGISLRIESAETGAVYIAETDRHGGFSIRLPAGSRYEVSLCDRELYAYWGILSLDRDREVRVVARAVPEVARHDALRLERELRRSSFALGSPDRLPWPDLDVVLVGEATHGTHEFAEIRGEILRYLIAHRGLSLLALEAPFSEVLVLDRYLQTGVGDPDSILASSLRPWPFRTRETVALLRWLRDHNVKSPERPVHVVGVDIQAAASSLARLRELVTQLRSVPPLPSELDVLATRPRTDDEKARWALARPALQRLREQIHGASGDERGIALQLVRSLEQDIDLAISRDHAVRERAMAENAIWAWSHFGSQPMAIWAHNMHLNGASLGQAVSFGALVRRRFRGRLLAIMLLFDEGRFVAVTPFGQAKGLGEGTVPPAPPRALESRLRAAAAWSTTLFDLRRLSASTKTLIEEPQVFRSIGAVYVSDDLTVSEVSSFDWVVLSRTSSPTTVLPRPPL